MTSMTSRIKSESNLKFQISTSFSFFFRLNKNAQLVQKSWKAISQVTKEDGASLCLRKFEQPPYYARGSRELGMNCWRWIFHMMSTLAAWGLACDAGAIGKKMLWVGEWQHQVFDPQRGSLVRSSPVDFLLRKRLDFNDVLQFDPRTLIFKLCARA